MTHEPTLADEVSEVELAELLAATQPVPRMAMVVRRLAFERDTLWQQIEAMQEVIRDSPILLDLSKTDAEFCEQYDEWRTQAMLFVET